MKHPEDLAHRLHIVKGNFFEADSIPRNHDSYLLKNILHDWDDDRAVQILVNVRKAMLSTMSTLATERKRILLIEHVLPDSNNSPHYGYLLDMLMLVSFF